MSRRNEKVSKYHTKYNILITYFGYADKQALAVLGVPLISIFASVLLRVKITHK
jgi:hypothetical protein